MVPQLAEYGIAPVLAYVDDIRLRRMELRPGQVAAYAPVQRVEQLFGEVAAETSQSVGHVSFLHPGNSFECIV